MPDVSIAKGSSVQIGTAGEFLDYWDNVRARTRRVVACIPPDRLERTHREGAFALGDLVRHLAAIERDLYAETVAGRPSHRGQIYLMLNMLGVPTPPLFGLTSEQVRERSAAS